MRWGYITKYKNPWTLIIVNCSMMFFAITVC